MHITFSGQPNNPKITLKLCRQALKFFASLLMSRRLSDTLDINVSFQDLIRKSTRAGERTFATAEAIFDETRYPKIFELVIDKTMGYKRILSSLAHELIHVEQMATGRMYEYEGSQGACRFEKRVIKYKELDYWDWPWEVEAYGREVGLYMRFLDHLKELKRKKK
jgi:hypothetical protein